MSEVLIKENPAIKLFGKIITLPPDKVVSDVITVHDSLEQRQNSSSTSTSQDSKDESGGEIIESKREDDSMNPMTETLTVPATSSGISYHSKTPNLEKNILNESISTQEKILKMPDKILPCTRCNSMDTKFCYYNNYNVNQPRHFCKNCQRYWTDGGTMRNVPVGSGRRRNKNVSLPYFRHIMVSDAVNGMCFPSLKPNGFFVFGLDRPLCECMNSTLNLAERSENCVCNEFYGHSSRSSSATSNSNEKGSHENNQELGLEKFGDKSSLEPCISQLPSGFPVTFYSSAPNWGCAFPRLWNVPCVTPTSSSSCQSALSSSPASNLGKYLREGTRLRPLNSGKENLSKKTSVDSSALISNSFRIDDPKEAAKSSTWSTVGVKNEKIDSLCGTRILKAFESKRDGSDNIDTTTMVLQANPAALSRSLNFHERHGFVIPKHS